MHFQMDTPSSKDADRQVVIEKRTAIANKLKRTRLCPQLQKNGTCPYGEHCRFAHGRNELIRRPDWKKTTLCRDYEQGSCGLKECHFAHGLHDLRFSLPHLDSNNACDADALTTYDFDAPPREQLAAPSGEAPKVTELQETRKGDTGAFESDGTPDPLRVTCSKRWQ
eukprot:TRINITY_DN30224_c0_g1_i1.p1 TRINITY_DN30224_c0_g1~~TRINITY_DN30224_c0_g1_i1.p1  ORF type:complete len:167 (-),score=15.72 TRINITY_DN30224_c0_g1_i1:416-916(-)